MKIFGKEHNVGTMLIGGFLGILFSELWWKFTGTEDPVTLTVDRFIGV